MPWFFHTKTQARKAKWKIGDSLFFAEFLKNNFILISSGFIKDEISCTPRSTRPVLHIFEILLIKLALNKDGLLGTSRPLPIRAPSLVWEVLGLKDCVRPRSGWKTNNQFLHIESP